MSWSAWRAVRSCCSHLGVLLDDNCASLISLISLCFSSMLNKDVIWIYSKAPFKLSLEIHLFKMLYRLVFLVNWLSLLEIIFQFKKNVFELIKTFGTCWKYRGGRVDKCWGFVPATLMATTARKCRRNWRHWPQILSQHICCMTAGYRRAVYRGLHNCIFVHVFKIHTPPPIPMFFRRGMNI